MPTWKPPESADSLPTRMRSNGPPSASSARIGVDERGRRRDRIPVRAVGLEVDGALDADGHRVAQLVGGLGRAEGHDDGLAAVRLDEPDRLLDRALLVRADDEAEVRGVDAPAVGGQVDPAAGGGHALDEGEDAHRPQLRIRSLSGSNSGVAPATATVTG